MLTNKTTNQLISTNLVHAKSFWQQAIGLMFHQKQDLIMYFNQERTISLHNFFVFFPLEIIILNEKKQVIEIRKEFRPFTFYRARNKGFYCIELAVNSSKNKCELHDFLDF
ncbi:hypothetical protein HOA92_06105 [archaeon]|jgi:uncharacterized protein|nr:hypothetical protein [archaeon]MBT6762584.1 hypothetical protein [archaeon]